MGLVVWLGAGTALAADGTGPVGYGAVEELFRKHCVDCHAAQEPEGGLVMESHAALLRGGKSGPAFKPGRASESLLVQAVETGLEREGRKRLMPPGKREKLKAEEIALLRRWIDGGAPGPAPGEAAGLSGSALARSLVLPRLSPTTPPPRAIRAAAYSSSLGLVALGRPGAVELVSPDTRQVVRTLDGLRGPVTALAFAAEGHLLVAASGEPGLYGEATVWNAKTGERVRRMEGHRDSLHAIALAPDGATLATGSYDQRIQLWSVADGQAGATLAAHNGAILGLAYRPDGRVLASASADRTVKLWQAGSGRRLDTLGQPTREVLALAWSPDGRRLAAVGADSRLRVWDVSPAATETSNPLRTTKYAHDGAVLTVAWSPDGRTLATSAEDRGIKLWHVDPGADGTVTEHKLLEPQPELAPALVFLGGPGRLLAGRMDGSWEIYDAREGGRAAVPAPGLRRVVPRGLNPGRPVELTLHGTNLAAATGVMTSHPDLKATLLPAEGATARRVSVEAGDAVPVGSHELWVRGPGGESGRVRIHLDRVPLLDGADSSQAFALPAALWGGLSRADEVDSYSFKAEAGRMVVVELAARSVGSRLQNGRVWIQDAAGALLGESAGFDGEDRRLAVRIPAAGTYVVRVADQMLQASADHDYRLTVGELPWVTGVYPLGVRTNAVTAVRLLGYNLGSNATVHVRSGADEGAVEVPLDLASGRHRAGRTFQVSVSSAPQVMETEGPSVVLSGGTGGDVAGLDVPVPGVAHGRIEREGDEDRFRFRARRGQVLVLETEAARRGSPVDTRLELLSAAEGRPVPWLLLQAVRNTAINFRGVDANGTGLRLDHYEEMDLNQYLYLNGDIMRLFRMPQGPDSDMQMYTVGGLRRAWFGSSAVAHAVDETGYIVEPHPVGARLVPNGLPVFTVPYANDDDGERRLGSDSLLRFTVPADGEYVARVSDARGQGGAAHAYRLLLREARPDFSLRASVVNPVVPVGSGQSFTISADRRDGFEGPITLDIAGAPPGFLVSTPLVIEAGHTEVQGTLFATATAGTNGPAGKEAAGVASTNVVAALRVTATAEVDGRKVMREGPTLGMPKVGAAPRIYVALEPDGPASDGAMRPYEPAGVTAGGEPPELVLSPGGEVPAWLKIRRNGHGDLVTFFAEGLPHGVIISDIGLNGVLIPKGEDGRKIFLSAARWVAPQDRLFYLVEQQAGRQTSRPIRLKIRR